METPMSERCPVCGNRLKHGECGNCHTYCTFCNYSEGVNQPEGFKEILIDGSRKSFMEWLRFVVENQTLPEEKRKELLAKLFIFQLKLNHRATCVPWPFEEELKDKGITEEWESKFMGGLYERNRKQ